MIHFNKKHWNANCGMPEFEIQVENDNNHENSNYITVKTSY